MTAAFAKEETEMSMTKWLTAAAMLALGCGGDDGGGKKKTANQPADSKPAPTEVAKKPDADKHDHSGWWCPEHGIPEEECSMCSDKVAKDCKAKGDWCEKHDRALSQCFVCKPERQEYYAAKHRAKYGKDPPPLEDEVVKQGKKG
jgi:hypothetical protein